jgi:hypothetical protein
MDNKEFMSGVVPWVKGGHVTIHWLNLKSRTKSGMPGRSCQTVDEAFRVVEELKQHKKTVEIYFCISSQHEGDGKRSTENAVYLCCLPFDFDLGEDNPKKYASPEQAIEALLQFCAELDIPKPSAAVLSGGGLHVYWWSNKYLTIDEWRPLALGVKAAALNWGLKIDPAVTGDVVRVLRVPGTQNHKYGEPRDVELLQCSGAKFDFAEIFGHLATQRIQPKARIRMAGAFAHLGPDQSMAGGIMGSLPLPFAPIKAECPWLRHVHDTGGIDQAEPSWRDAIRCSIFLEDGKTLIHEFSREHRDYEFAATEAKYDLAYAAKADKDLGYPQCQTISNNGAHDHCKACPHRDKGKSPLHFGLVAALDAEDDKEMQELGGTRPSALRLPKGYCLNEKGQLCCFVPTTVNKRKQAVPGRLVLLISNHIRDPNLQLYGDQHGISFIAEATRGREVEVFLDAISVYRETGLLKMLPKNNVLYNPEPEAKNMIEKFFKSWLDKLSEEDTPTVRDPTMGWKYIEGERVGFVYGGKMYHQSGTVTAIPQVQADDKFNSYYMPTGSVEIWRKAAKLLTDRKRPELDVIISAAFAGPLMVFAGTLYGTVLSVWGEPGTAKSTAQQVAAAVWGHPKQTRESLNSTPKSVQGRLGRTKNLPAYWDDIQDERHQQILFDTMFVTTEGTEGGRLNPDASYKERLEWQSLVVVCANASFIDYLTRKQKSTTAGMRRVFEFEFNKRQTERIGVEPGFINPIEASQTFAKLEHNFGGMGAAYVQMLARNHEDVNKLFFSITDGFRETVDGSSDESFWWGLCGLLLTGAVLARRMDVELDVEAMKVFLLKAFLRNRRVRKDEATEGGSIANTEQAITAFCNQHLGNGNVIYTAKKFEHREIPVMVLGTQYPATNRAIYLQIVRDARMVLISKRAFKKFLDDNDIRPRQVLNGMAEFFDAKERKHTLGAGTSFAQTQELCIEFVVPFGPSIFDGMMTAQGQPESRPQLVPSTTRDTDGT